LKKKEIKLLANKYIKNIHKTDYPNCDIGTFIEVLQCIQAGYSLHVCEHSHNQSTYKEYEIKDYSIKSLASYLSSGCTLKLVANNILPEAIIPPCLKKHPKQDELIYMVDTLSSVYFVTAYWNSSSETHLRAFNRGLVYLSEDEAKAACLAMIKRQDAEGKEIKRERTNGLD
jgi:hypothetical protein